MISETQLIHFVSNVPVFQGEVKTLVIHCSQHNFQPQIDDFVRNGLGKESFDRIAVPGGPQFLLGIYYLPKFMWTGNKWAQFLVEKHGLEEAIVIAHEDCGWYKEMIVPASATPKMLKTKATSDLEKAIYTVEKICRVHASAFYAQINEKGLIEFIAS